MTARDILAFQFGRADAIRTVASSSSAIWTGIVLVLLTAFAQLGSLDLLPCRCNC